MPAEEPSLVMTTGTRYDGAAAYVNRVSTRSCPSHRPMDSGRPGAAVALMANRMEEPVFGFVTPRGWPTRVVGALRSGTDRGPQSVMMGVLATWVMSTLTL